MPPILLLKGDNLFYGKIKPEGIRKEENSFNSDKPALPPNPLTTTSLTTKTSRDFGTAKLTNQIENPNAGTNKNIIQETDNIQSKERKLDEYIEKKDSSLGQQITNFLTTPLVETSQEAKKTQRERERERIGVGTAPVSNEIRPIGEVSNEVIIKPVINFGNEILEGAEMKIIQAGLFFAGVYLLGEFLKRPQKD